MPRSAQFIKHLTTSLRVTKDMDDYIHEAANIVGATKAEIYRLGAVEAAKQIYSDDQVRSELRQRFAV
jgi:hypothetical protein